MDKHTLYVAVRKSVIKLTEKGLITAPMLQEILSEMKKVQENFESSSDEDELMKTLVLLLESIYEE